MPLDWWWRRGPVRRCIAPTTTLAAARAPMGGVASSIFGSISGSVTYWRPLARLPWFPVVGDRVKGSIQVEGAGSAVAVIP